MARVKDEDLRNIDEEDFIAQTKKYAFIKAQLEFLEKEQKTLRTQLFEVLDAEGQEDDKGNIIIELPSDIDGVSSLVKQRRVSRKIDEDKAAEIIAYQLPSAKIYFINVSKRICWYGKYPRSLPTCH